MGLNDGILDTAFVNINGKYTRIAETPYPDARITGISSGTDDSLMPSCPDQWIVPTQQYGKLLLIPRANSTAT
jgi:hypothetical protein